MNTFTDSYGVYSSALSNQNDPLLPKIQQFFNKKGVVTLDENGFKYHKKHDLKKSGTTLYTCIKRKYAYCRAAMKVKNDIIVAKIDEHNHESDE